ncbi:ATP-binding cassette domain-containing protein [Pseudomonadota bacterium AL_CKDN230030165-1A_HGKHYDSX7]
MPHQALPPLVGQPASRPRLSLRDLACDRLSPVSFDLAAGECIAILGPSGAGKSVLLRQIADLDPGSGEALLDGLARSSMQAPQWRRQVVYCQAEAGWWHEHVGAHFPDHVAAREMLDRLGLDAAKLDAQVHECSTGERQRLGLARALLLEPAVLLLDEPTAALDVQSITRVEDVLRAALARGAGLVLVTHNDAQARRLAARCFHMEAGRLMALDPREVTAPGAGAAAWA